VIIMQVADVTFRNEQSASVLLVDEAKQIRLRYGLSAADGAAILAARNQTPALPPPTQVMFLEALQRFDIRVSRAAINELRDGELVAHLELQSGAGKNACVDASPSDAILVALRANVPLEVSEQVIAEVGSQRGRLIDVGGYRLSAHVKGSGSPIVVLEAPFGTGHEIWSKIRDDIAEFTTVCCYDRAGLGWSDSAPGSRTFQDSVKDVHALLQGFALPAPYVLVGHSIGGSLALLFADAYAAEMAGVVLVDSSHPDQRARFLTALPLETADESPSVRTFRKNLLNPATLLPEWGDATVCFEQAQACGGLGNLPLAVITATRRENPLNLPEDVFEARYQVWQELQQGLVRRSTRTTQRFAEQSGHVVPFDQPEIVIDTIREIVEIIRQA
jgi:pimeloyl-ACP methyl ester carboxylesterase/bifunctional DNase/RNase